MTEPSSKLERVMAERDEAYTSLAQAGETAKVLRRRLDDARDELATVYSVLAECAAAELPSDLLQKVTDTLAGDADG